MKVTTAGVHVEIDSNGILHGVDLHVTSRCLHGLVGPNGSGKSTLLRCIYRSLRPTHGVVCLDDEDLWGELSARSAAKRRAVVTQDNGLELAFTTREVVAMGRAPHKGLFERDNTNDEAIVDDALEAVEMSWARSRTLVTLSGGERQRVLLARALAQQTPILVLDEPTNHLDIRAQLELLDLVKSLGLTTIAALHDLDHAASICDEISVIDDGRIVASGAPFQVLTVDLIREVFGVAAHIGTHPLTGRTHIAIAALSRPVPTQPPNDSEGA